jgi:hypothetical protein
MALLMRDRDDPDQRCILIDSVMEHIRESSQWDSAVNRSDSLTDLLVFLDQAQDPMKLLNEVNRQFPAFLNIETCY